MAITVIQIQRYQYYVFSSRDSSTSPSTVILLFDPANTMVGSLFFVKEPGSLPPASEFGGRYLLAYSYADLPVIVDMLRNETPVYLIVDPAGLVVNWRLSTSEEPVGEGEL
ncbi:MAG: hypothetical protein ABW022_13570 [Actinoplanes sp.]